MALCLHILRLRPSPQELKAWNRDEADAKQPTKTHEQGYWTAFLKELAPPTILDDLSAGEPIEKIERKRKIMLKMYEIAEKEECYADEGCGEHCRCLLLLSFETHC